MRKFLFILINVTLLTFCMGLNANAKPPRHSHNGHRAGHHQEFRHRGPMNSSTFNSVCEKVKEAGWQNGKHYDVVSDAISDGHIFSVAQTVRILKLFGSYYEKEKVALIIYPSVYDREYWYQVYDSFNDYYWREDLKRKIAEIDSHR
ncbi:MAG: DUF4476 domain-containing protein [Proteobacteria bacterium]|nr:DUF4476 domain-containing protein [Pseudomonadota bacterium]